MLSCFPPQNSQDDMHVAITYLSNTLIIQHLILVLFLSLESQAYHICYRTK